MLDATNELIFQAVALCDQIKKDLIHGIETMTSADFLHVVAEVQLLEKKVEDAHNTEYGA